jgi:hypothetical protein
MRHSAEAQVKPILLLIIERLRKILSDQCYLQGEHVGAYLVLFRISVYSMCLVPRNKAAPGIGSDINLAFRPDDNHHLIVHEYSGLEPGDGHGLRTIRDFITVRTDQNRASAERLHAVW